MTVRIEDCKNRIAVQLFRTTKPNRNNLNLFIVKRTFGILISINELERFRL